MKSPRQVLLAVPAECATRAFIFAVSEMLEEEAIHAETTARRLMPEFSGRLIDRARLLRVLRDRFEALANELPEE